MDTSSPWLFERSCTNRVRLMSTLFQMTTHPTNIPTHWGFHTPLISDNRKHAWETCNTIFGRGGERENKCYASASSSCLQHPCVWYNFRLVSLVPSIFLILFGPIRLWILLKKRDALAPELIRNRLYFIKLVRKKLPINANTSGTLTYHVMLYKTTHVDHIDLVVVYIISSTCIVHWFVAFADIKHDFSGKSHFSLPLTLIHTSTYSPMRGSSHSSLQLHCTMSNTHITLSVLASSCFIGFQFWLSTEHNGLHGTWTTTHLFKSNIFSYPTHISYSRRRMLCHWLCLFWNHAIDLLIQVSFLNLKR